jgi:hypothetical protein
MKNRLYLSLLIATLLCLAGWTAHAELQRSSPARQAWEYKSLVLVVDGSRTTLYEDAKTVPGTPVTRMPELGAQGWELVSVAADNSTYAYWLKRPK